MIGCAFIDPNFPIIRLLTSHHRLSEDVATTSIVKAGKPGKDGTELHTVYLGVYNPALKLVKRQGGIKPGRNRWPVKKTSTASSVTGPTIRKASACGKR